MDSSDRLLELHLLTACIRVGNLEALADSIRAAAFPESVRIEWNVFLDDRFDLDIEQARRVVSALPWATLTLSHGQDVWNLALDSVRTGWVLFLDDDNLLHPALPRRLAETIRNRPEAGAIVFDQDLGGEIRKAARENVRVGHIDGGQYALSRDFVGEERFDLYVPSGDGVLIERLHRKAPRRFVFLHEVLAYYNALTPGHFGEPGVRRLTPGPLPPIQSAASLVEHRTHPRELRNAILLSSSGATLFLDGDVVLRSRLAPGRCRLKARIWLDASAASSGRFKVTESGRAIVDCVVAPSVPMALGRIRPLYRLMSRLLRRVRQIDEVFHAEGEVEISFTPLNDGPARLVVDALSVESLQKE